MALEQLREFTRPEVRALHVGLTGGIGAGKSTVAELLRSYGAVVVDADELARTVVEPGSLGLARLREIFGDSILTADGRLDRQALATAIFADPEALARVESVLHPLIAAEKDRIFSALKPGQVGVYDVPLLTEKGMAPQFDAVILVEAPASQRVDRLERRGMSRVDANNRIAAQATDAERREVATFLLLNDGDVEALRADVANLGRQHLHLPFAGIGT